MIKEKRIKKNDGRLEPYSADKIHEKVLLAFEGLSGVSPSMVEMNAGLSIEDKTSSRDVQTALIQSSADLISEETPNYDKATARLLNQQVRKDVYGQYQPLDFYSEVVKRCKQGIYDKVLLKHYTEDEIRYFGKKLKYDRDDNFTYTGLQQMAGKYLLKRKGRVVETPQEVFMLMNMYIFANYEPNLRKKWVLEGYRCLSTFEVSLPTPQMNGLRTDFKRFISCNLIEAGDTTESLALASAFIMMMTANKSGIGVGAGDIRGLGADIGNGRVEHTGILPILKTFEKSTKAFTQIGRGGSSTNFYPFFHYEAETIMQLGNAKGTEETRVRHADHTIVFNQLFIERLLNKEDITLFHMNEVPELHDKIGSEEFKELYEHYEKTVKKKHKKVISADNYVRMFMKERFLQGRLYWMFADNTNQQGMWKMPIKQSNLCVAPETKILTDKGYVEIQSVAGTKQNVWNGAEWSEVDIVKTGENQELLTIDTTGGILECTPYHKFYVKTGYGKNQIIEKRANELVEGDKLIKYELPTIEGNKLLEHPYANGFFTGDGCENGGDLIYLYHDKRKLRHRFNNLELTSDINYPKEKRQVLRVKKGQLKPKYFVPTADYTIKSRIDWFSGLIDADGCLTGNQGSQSIQISQVNIHFLHEVRLMLQTLGVDSKIILGQEKGYRFMPKNDGTGDSQEYLCQRADRLLIAEGGVQQLIKLGLSTDRLKPKKRIPQRDARNFIKVISVKNEGRISDTYCFNEPKRHLGMFNGMLTGQCLEITLPTKPLDQEDAEIACCILAGLNHGHIEDDRIANASEYLVRFLEEMIDYMDYTHKEIEIPAKKRRTLGIGHSDVFHYLAKNKQFYNTSEGRQFLNRRLEASTYYMTKTSIELAKEKGACEYFKDTKYSDGLFTIDTYNKNVDELVSNELEYDWETLREDLKKYGMRHSTLSANAPFGNSCMKLDQKIQTNEGDMDFHDLCRRENIDISKLTPNWYNLNTPLEIPTKQGVYTSNKFRFNGVVETFEIEMEDGYTTRLTGNHKLWCKRDGEYQWVRVDELEEGDDILKIE